MKKVTIIGGGLSGLVASCYLAKNNYDVTLIDKNNKMGGRLSFFKKNGFTFDLGPSWYWMPDVFESFFKDFNKNINDYYQLKRINPSYKFFLTNKDISIPINIDEIYKLFDRIESDSSIELKEFIKQAGKKYDISMNHFIHLPNKSLKEYFKFSILRDFLSLDLFKSLRSHILSFFKNKDLRYILEFPSMFLGGSPKNTPALYSLMNYADIVYGTWYPMGGMYKITESVCDLSKELGVKHVLNEEIINFKINNKKIENIVSKNKNKYKSDFYICCAEYPHVQMKLINSKNRSYNANYWSKRNVAPSALIFYLGFSEKIENLEHHNLFFDKDFDNHINDIFERKVWPKDPLFYICCPSKTDSSVVPNEDYENLFILVPIGSGFEDNEVIREKYFLKIVSRIENKIGQTISDKIIVKESFCVNDFEKEYNSYRGNAYGLANTLFQTALFKPKMKDKKIKNLYYSGQFTIPGPGLPPAIISGKIVSNQIIRG